MGMASAVSAVRPIGKCAVFLVLIGSASVGADDKVPAHVVRRGQVVDGAMPRPVSGPFMASVVDAGGKPIAGAIIDGVYQSTSSRFTAAVADAQGTIKIERYFDPLVLWAATPDKSRAGTLRVDATATAARLVAKPTATASGRLVDMEGKAIAGRKLTYGIRVALGSTRQSAFRWSFGGTTTTDPAGRFDLAGLVVGETYEIYVTGVNGRRGGTVTRKVSPTSAALVVLGDLAIDLRPRQRYVPPTAAQRADEAFAAWKEKPPREKLEFVLDEANREYTRPLLLFGSARHPACIDFFRAIQEGAANEKPANGKPLLKSPIDLRWEYELLALDANKADVRALATAIGLPLTDGEPPRLAVLSDKRKLTASYPLRLGVDDKLDVRALGAFLLVHKLPTRDAETMLAQALAKANAEDKSVFLILSASSCVPCRMLARFLVANQAELGRYYVFVIVDVTRDKHADAVRQRYETKGDVNGVPWYAILDRYGKPIISSNAKELGEEYASSNIGFPSSKEGIDHFLKMLRQTAPGLSSGALVALRRGLELGATGPSPQPSPSRRGSR